MRYSFIIIVLLWSTIANGQKSSLSARLALLVDSPNPLFDTTGLSQLPKIDNHCSRNNKNPYDFYHVTDLNNDGEKDLIYSGPCEPSEQTSIYINTGGRLKRVFAFPGKVVAIERKTSGSILHILKDVCCCYPFREFIQVNIDNDSKITKNVITLGADTRVRLNARFKVDKVMGTIRTTPIVNDVPKADACKRQVYRGNQLRRVEGFKDVTQLYRSGAWWLVLFRENEERSWLGWMKLESE
jgi:hypothetical protein